MNGFSTEELNVLSTLKTPAKIQDFLNSFPMNFEPNGETCMSPRRVLRERKAHCMEGAMFAAAALRLIGYKPLLMDLQSFPKDHDHVVAVFQENGYWGAISKTNHGVLRYREPVYKTVRELAMSYFHEYFLNDGRKTLRAYSAPFDLSKYDKDGWMTDEEDMWYIPIALDESKHFPILTRSQIGKLRKADPIEIDMGKLIQWPVPKKKS
jgi:hypothetical protein